MVRADTAKVKAGFENIVVPEELTRGGKFIKWEQVGNSFDSFDKYQIVVIDVDFSRAM